MTIEEYTGKGSRPLRFYQSPTHLVVLSASSSKEMAEKCRKLLDDIPRRTSIANVARETQLAEHAAPGMRLAIVAADFEDLTRKLKTAIEQCSKSNGGNFSLPDLLCSNDAKPGNIAFVFPGQGSQYVAMGSDLCTTFNEVNETWSAVADIPLDEKESLHGVVFPIPVFEDDKRAAQSAKLMQTQWAQPALGTVSASMLGLLEKLHIKPDCVAGHSYGELTALYAAGCVDLPTFCRMSRKRGELMAQASKEKAGAMLAVLHDVDQVLKKMEEWNIADVVPANFNSPEQIVLSGTVKGIEAIEKRLAAEKISCKRLPVATAFHSSIVQDACAPFLKWLESAPFSKPKIDVYSNVTAKVHAAEPSSIKNSLAQQIANPVLFSQLIKAMHERGVRTFIEVGPQGVLARLVQGCLDGQEFRAISMDKKGAHGLASLWKALAECFVSGITPSFARLWEEFRTEEEILESKGHVVKIKGCNYGKPYPPKEGAAGLPKPVLRRETNPIALETKPVIKDVIEEEYMAEKKPSGQEMQYAQAAAQQPGWIQLFNAFQQRIAEAHAAYQQSMANSHMAFLRTAEHSLAMLSGNAPTQPGKGGNGSCDDMSFQLPVMMPSQPAPAYRFDAGMDFQMGMAAPAVPQPMPFAPLPQAAPAFAPPMESAMSQSPQPAAAPMPPSSRPVAAAPAPSAAPSAKLDASSLSDVMLKVVAEKTGYPVDMLGMEMELEGDLGVDSIKRVEILSAVKEEVPEMPELNAQEMANLKTLQEIADYLKAQMGVGGGAVKKN
jgi:malonyl CoA-acyl carrier protein transacylase